MRECADKEQSLVEADELVRVVEVEFGQLGQQFRNDGRVASIKAAFGGF
jgi:hypothetical protein